MDKILVVQVNNHQVLGKIKVRTKVVDKDKAQEADRGLVLEVVKAKVKVDQEEQVLVQEQVQGLDGILVAL